jgi:hypothetical protein
MPIADHRRQPLPQRRYAETFELRHGRQAGAMFHVTLGRYPDGRIGEVFITGAKAGSDLEAGLRDAAILVSLALQHGVPVATLAAAITREGDGKPSTVIGAMLDQLAKGVR